MRHGSAGIENEGLEQGDELFSREAFSFWHGEMLGRLPFLISESKVNHSHMASKSPACSWSFFSLRLLHSYNQIVQVDIVVLY